MSVAVEYERLTLTATELRKYILLAIASKDKLRARLRLSGGSS